jgi:hypothetical protein
VSLILHLGAAGGVDTALGAAGVDTALCVGVALLGVAVDGGVDTGLSAGVAVDGIMTAVFAGV